MEIIVIIVLLGVLIYAFRGGGTGGGGATPTWRWRLWWRLWWWRLKMSRLYYTTIILYTLFFTACSNPVHESKKPNPENLATEEITFSDKTKSVSRWGQDDVSLIEVKVEYVGKSPKLPSKGPLPSYDWNNKNTDFLQYRNQKSTNSPIQLLKTINIFQFGAPGDVF